MTPSTRIAIVEDHALLAQSLGFALSAAGLAITVGSVESREAALETVAPDETTLLLLDLDLGAPIVDGVSLVAPVCAAGARVLVVTGSLDLTRIASAVEAGAVGYVRKEQPFDLLLDTVLRVAAGEPALRAGEREDLLALLRSAREDERRRFAPFRELSPREQEVLAALAEGKSVERIASDWVVSEATVRTQVRGVLTKLDVRSQLAAVAKAREAGWPAP